MEDKKLEVSLKLINSVLQYLGTKPFQEVYGLVDAIQKEVGPQMAPSKTEPNE